MINDVRSHPWIESLSKMLDWQRIDAEREETFRRNIRRYRRAQEIMRPYPPLACAKCGAAVAAEPIDTKEGAIVFSPLRCPCGHLTKIHLLKRDWKMEATRVINPEPVRYWWEPWISAAKK